MTMQSETASRIAQRLLDDISAQIGPVHDLSPHIAILIQILADELDDIREGNAHKGPRCQEAHCNAPVSRYSTCGVLNACQGITAYCKDHGGPQRAADEMTQHHSTHKERTT